MQIVCASTATSLPSLAITALRSTMLNTCRQTLRQPQQNRLREKHPASATRPGPPTRRRGSIDRRLPQLFRQSRDYALPDCKARRAVSHVLTARRSARQLRQATELVRKLNLQFPLPAVSIPAVRNSRDPDTRGAPQWPASSEAPAPLSSPLSVRRPHVRRKRYSPT